MIDGVDLIIGQSPQASACLLVRRLLAPSGDYLVAADIDTIELSVTNLRTPNQRVTNFDALAITPSDVLSAIVDDTPWVFDAVGYNFLYVLPAEARPAAETYQVEFLFTPVDGSPFYVRYQIESLRVFAEG